jgi:HEPN domain-containing protein
MARLRTEEVRRLMNYLSRQLRDPERLAEIEDALRNEYADHNYRPLHNLWTSAATRQIDYAAC